MDKIRRTAAVLAKVNRSWMEVASQGAEKIVYPAVDASVIFPDALSIEEVGLRRMLASKCLVYINSHEISYI